MIVKTTIKLESTLLQELKIAGIKQRKTIQHCIAEAIVDWLKKQVEIQKEK